MSGLFVAIDGPGGAGKSTTAGHLTTALTALGVPVTATTEPSHAPLGRFVRAHTGHYHGLALACLVAADRYHHLETEIRPALAADRLVLCDRYIASSLVLQSGIDQVPAEFVHHLNAHAEWPDVNVVLTAPVEVLHQRLAARGSHGRFEDDLTITAREAVLYREAITTLDQAGVTTVVVDTSVEDAVPRLTATLGALWSHRHQGSAEGEAAC